MAIFQELYDDKKQRSQKLDSAIVLKLRQIHFWQNKHRLKLLGIHKFPLHTRTWV